MFSSRLSLCFGRLPLQAVQAFATKAKPAAKVAKTGSNAAATPKVPKAPKVPASDKKFYGRLDLVDAVIADAGVDISKASADKLIVSVLSNIKKIVLEQGKEVRIVGLGTFYKKSIAARTRRNPSTGTTFDSPASEKLGFKSSALTRKQLTN